MALTVMKFGGAALSDTEHMKGAADLIKKEHLSGNSVVAVLSARGDTTDILSDMGSEVSKNPDKRENDVLLAAGDRVRHPMFGEGLILSANKMGADTLYEVAFDTVGTKKLMATFAKLTKI